VIGTPIEFGAGLMVMPANLSGTDAVPLIDGQTAGILQAINSFTIKQRVCIYVESTACEWSDSAADWLAAGWPRPADAKGSPVHYLSVDGTSAGEF
jgi:hypothetical protein